ncbi:MAG: 50S ribosomal protein L13 [Caulobacterales bacterium]|jgi:large subunit ribosomal protein L13
MLTKATRSATTETAQHRWIVVDAEGAIVGRLAAYIALHLRGKHRADFTPHADVGDHVVVINADKVVLTGNKLTDKVYYRHTGYPGGIKERRAGQMLSGRFPERVLEMAVKRMMPKESPLARRQLAKLRVYAGAEHPHAAQSPTTVDFKALNRKNSRTA